MFASASLKFDITLFFFRMSAFDSPLAKPQTSVTNMSANAGAELSIF